MNQPFTWADLRQHLKERLSADDFRAWIVPLRVVRSESERIILDAPNDRFVAILEESLRPTIDAVVEDIFGSGLTVDISATQMALGGLEFDTDRRHSAPTRFRSGSTGGERIEARRARQPQAALVATSTSRATSPLSDLDPAAEAAAPVQESDLSQGVNRQTPSLTHQPSSGDRQPAARPTGATRFNPKYRFSNFVVGDSNQFACAAARAVAESPGQSYNPLFLYGGVGLGKTHLLHAIAQEILHGQPGLEVHYISAEQFLNELINSIRFDRMPLFRERYRSIDVLLIDDIQFLANKERTQEEFFHTFNALYTAEKQIILSSDASPKDIPTLEERLRSRFEWGLITDIQPPDLETKIAILRRKAALRRCELDDEVAMFIASQVRSNVRELEGLLNRAIAFASMTGRPLDLDLARETLKEILPQTDARRNAAEIIRTVAKAYGLKVTEIKSKNKAHQISFPRQVAMYLCKQLTDLSFPEIGKQFSNKHHSTVMHSVEKITKLRKEDSELDRLIERLVLQLR